ncbi:hypothetical protein [Furfurilactobacillus siliginis]|uniref:Uncharacterized protein n=1 Tax=Furfurilactobacillus siliginis TaxID=348151 RepID=A0A0R2L8Q0_9LACO|nr:hypothetical protein [Furfurilactobacillus siliginis]KRN94884.1 hypothetical protein IV55_GL000426 [Furfurilactobacillus siliginis]GEK28456.1 hypothetical protein LSI01_07670 [Furfurilactobacillus siliginis]
MSNKTEILEEYREATTELAALQDTSATDKQGMPNRIDSLRGKCDQLDAILEAMDAAED